MEIKRSVESVWAESGEFSKSILPETGPLKFYSAFPDLLLRDRTLARLCTIFGGTPYIPRDWMNRAHIRDVARLHLEREGHGRKPNYIT